MNDTPSDRVADAAAFLNQPAEDGTSPERQAEVEALGEKIIDVLKTIYDPEIPVNIYELGLVYKIDVDDDDKVHIDMTLTSPACPVAETLPPEVERKVATVDGVQGCSVEVVWDPPWHPSMMTEEAQLELGLIY
ncbi:MAG: SUF system Fe-S cluster assembly protein [Geminicoccaceae bacterium]|nr:MAG: SUF system Fe-S cluster assembly protein [Geminicoccaceae bacterium]